MSSLLLHLLPSPLPASAERSATAQAAYGFVVVQANGSVSNHGQAALALLPACDEVVLVVDVQALSWQRLALPKLPRGAGAAKLRAVLDGMLEDKLLDEVSSLHFALAPSAVVSPEGVSQTWVAVCDKAWLAAQIAALEAAGQRVARIVPQRFPAGAVAAHIHGSPEAALVTTADAQGVRCLPLAAAKAMGLLSAPEVLASLTAEPAVAAQAEALLEQRVAIVQSAQDLAASFSSAQQAQWSLAQFDLSLSGRGRLLAQLSQGLRAFASAPRWTAARWAIGLVLVANLVGLNALAYKEKSALEAKRMQVNALLTQTHPQVKLVVDAPVQMQRELALLRAATGALTARDLEAIFTSISANVGAKWSYTAIEYAADGLKLQGGNLPAAELSGAIQALAAKGYQLLREGDKLIISPSPSPSAGGKL